MSDEFTMQNIVAICPRCQKTYGVGIERCPDDTMKLLIVRQNESRRVGSVLDDKYTILGQLGRGGMGTVYRALQHNMEREVAVKVMRESVAEDVTAVKRFLREAKQSSRLNHPHIITLFDFGQTDEGDLYLVMEVLSGRPLSDIIDDEGPMEAARAVKIIGQVCDALEHAHEMDIIHRDLKPENIFMLDEALSGGHSDYAKVLDFGLAKIIGEESHDSLTRTGSINGTPAYMSPEQVRGRAVDGRSDVYSLGIVLYELLSGRRPYQGASPVDICLAHVTAEPAPLREADPSIMVPATVERVVMRALAKEPEDRPQSASGFRKELVAAIENPQSDVETTMLSAVNVPLQDDVDTEIGLTALGLGGLGRSRAFKWASGFVLVAAIAFAGYLLGPHLLPGDEEEPAIEAVDDSVSEAPAPSIGEDNDPAPGTAADLDPAARVNNPSPSVLVVKEDGAEPIAKEPVVVPSPPEMILVKTKPENAKIWINGERRGRSPVEVERPEEGATIKVKMMKTGYKTKTGTLLPNSEAELTFKLVRSHKKPPKKEEHGFLE